VTAAVLKQLSRVWVSGNSSAGWAREVDRIFTELEQPELLPALGPIVAASDGALWLARFTVDPDAPQEWLVVARRRDVAKIVRTPRRFRLVSVTDAGLLGIQSDDDDVPHVVRYALP
jgi:hypothetical protein